MKTQVTFTITRDLSDVDFTNCGDGCGGDATLEGATYRGEKIDCFASDDVDAAHAAMVDYLGNVRDAGERYQQRAIENDRRARRAEIAAEVQAEFMRDPLTVNRRNG